MKKKGIISTILFFMSFSFGLTVGIGASKPEKEVFAYKEGKIIEKSIVFQQKLLIDMPESPVVLEEEMPVVEEFGPVELRELTVVADNITHNEKCVDSDTGDEEQLVAQIEELPVPIVLLDVVPGMDISEVIMLI